MKLVEFKLSDGKRVAINPDKVADLETVLDLDGSTKVNFDDGTSMRIDTDFDTVKIALLQD